MRRGLANRERNVCAFDGVKMWKRNGKAVQRRHFWAELMVVIIVIMSACVGKAPSPPGQAGKADQFSTPNSTGLPPQREARHGHRGQNAERL